MELYEFHEHPDLDAPPLVLALDGWIDAGLGASQALAVMLQELDTVTVATFDADDLLDHRARRPVMHLVDGVLADLAWPSIELRAATDRDGNDLLLLVGAEPDHRWHAFTRAVTGLALELGARMVVGLGAYPAAVPHTRPAQLSATASSPELARLVGFLPGTVDVPGGVHAAIEREAAAAGLPAVGLWAQVPHYAAGLPYPAASLALLEGLAEVAGLRFGGGTLAEEAAATRTRLDALIANSDEHQALVHQLEVQADQRQDLPSGDELAAEVERFLRDRNDPGTP